MITKLKIHVEEEKRIEEALKEWLEEKCRIIGGLEVEIVTLRKDLQKKNMQNKSKVLDEIISSERKNHDKSRLGYNQAKKMVKLQNNISRNTTKKLCRDIQKRQEFLQGRSQR